METTFSVHFFEWWLLYFDSQFTKFDSWGANGLEANVVRRYGELTPHGHLMLLHTTIGNCSQLKSISIPQFSKSFGAQRCVKDDRKTAFYVKTIGWPGSDYRLDNNMIIFRIVWLLGCDVCTCTLYIKHLPKLYVILSTYILHVSCGNRPWNIDVKLYCEIHVCIYSWCRHQMEACSALLANCAGISPVKGRWRRVLMFSLICTWINGWVRLVIWDAIAPLWRHSKVCATRNGHVLRIARNLFVAEWIWIHMNHLCAKCPGTQRIASCKSKMILWW